MTGGFSTTHARKGLIMTTKLVKAGITCNIIMLLSIHHTHTGYACDAMEIDFNENSSLEQKKKSSQSDCLAEKYKTPYQQRKNNPRLVDAAYSRQDQWVETQYQQGSDINSQNDAGNSALHGAAYTNNLPLTDQLIRWNAQVNLQNKHGDTPLFVAAKRASLELCERLLAANGDPRKQENNGYYPLWAALYNEDKRVLPLLLTQKGFDANTQMPNLRESLLHSAIKLRKISAIQSLLEHGANPFGENQDGETPEELATNSQNRIIWNLVYEAQQQTKRKRR